MIVSALLVDWVLSASWVPAPPPREQYLLQFVTVVALLASVAAGAVSTLLGPASTPVWASTT